MLCVFMLLGHLNLDWWAWENPSSSDLQCVITLCLLSPTVSRFLCDPGGEPVVEPVHQHSSPRQAHVCVVGGPPGERWARPPAETHHDALRQPVGPAHPPFCQHGCLQAIPHHGPCGGGWWVGPYNINCDLVVSQVFSCTIINNGFKMNRTWNK